MEIDNLPFRQAFQKLHLHKYKEPAWKLLETLCWEDRTALKVCFNETKKRIYSVTAYSWLKNRLCLVKCAVYPCLESDGRVDIWNMSDIDLINDGRDDNSELEEMLKLEDILKAYAGFSLEFEDEPRDIYKERWYTTEDYGNYDGWIQCRFAEKFIETHRQYTLPKYRYIEDENGDYYVVCD